MGLVLGGGLLVKTWRYSRTSHDELNSILRTHEYMNKFQGTNIIMLVHFYIVETSLIGVRTAGPKVSVIIKVPLCMTYFCRSFLYHLDCHSFLLKPVPTLTIKPLIDHVAVGYGHIVAVTLEHTVFSWGEGGRGQLGHGDTVSRSSPQLVDALKSSAVIM